MLCGKYCSYFFKLHLKYIDENIITCHINIFINPENNKYKLNKCLNELNK